MGKNQNYMSGGIDILEEIIKSAYLISERMCFARKEGGNGMKKRIQCKKEAADG